MNWEASLGDARLSRRLVKLATRWPRALGEYSAGVPGAGPRCERAYRFLAQDKLDWQDILQPHWDATAQMHARAPVVLCLQDTTELDFEGKATRGLGPLSYEAQRGMYRIRPMWSRRAGRRWA